MYADSDLSTLYVWTVLCIGTKSPINSIHMRKHVYRGSYKQSFCIYDESNHALVRKYSHPTFVNHQGNKQNEAYLFFCLSNLHIYSTKKVKEIVFEGL